MAMPALSVLIVSAGPAAELVAAVRTAGHNVRVAGDSAADPSGGTPDVVLLDMANPPAEVFALAQRVAHRGWPQHPLLIAVGGPTDPPARRRTVAAGIDLHLLPPAEGDGLISLLARYAALLHLTGPGPSR
ncbi:MAG TPA: hypothetical protein VGF55_14530 [Gemmataceae bacterium]|jgi:CheY-like chemotaxis protein